MCVKVYQKKTTQKVCDSMRRANCENHKIKEEMNAGSKMVTTKYERTNILFHNILMRETLCVVLCLPSLISGYFARASSSVLPETTTDFTLVFHLHNLMKNDLLTIDRYGKKTTHKVLKAYFLTSLLLSLNNRKNAKLKKNVVGSTHKICLNVCTRRQ